MPVADIIVLAIIMAVFTTFSIVLAGVAWYCRDKRKRPIDHHGYRRYQYPTDVLVDD